MLTLNLLTAGPDLEPGNRFTEALNLLQNLFLTSNLLGMSIAVLLISVNVIGVVDENMVAIARTDVVGLLSTVVL